MIAAASLLALVASGAPAPDRESALDQALECRVYTDLALSVHRDPRMLAADRKLHRYWAKRGDELGKEMGLSPQELRMRPLLIPIMAERFKDVLVGCLEAAPEDVLR